MQSSHCCPLGIIRVSAPVSQQGGSHVEADARRPLLCGVADQLTPAEHSQAIAASIPGSRLELIPRSGHMLTMEQPEVVSAILKAWLERVAPGP